MFQYIDLVSDLQGNALFNATVTVQNYVGGGLASIYSDNGLTPIAGSVVSTDITGQYSFFAADGDYNLVIRVNGTIYKTLAPVSMFDGAAQVTQTDTGVVNAYASTSPVLEKQLRTGLRSWFKAANTNTGPSTYAYNGLAAKNLVAFDGSVLSAGVIVTGGIYGAEYNGTAWQLTAALLTSSSVGPLVFPPTTAETAAGFTASSLLQQYEYGNVLRYGVVANNPGAAANNTSVFAQLVSASVPNGPTGWIHFPNSGAGATNPDIYYFGTAAAFQVRDWCDIDLQGCTLNFSGAFNAALNTMGFFTLVRNATLRNGTIIVNYNGTGGTNNGAPIRIGSRSGYAWGPFTTGIFDQDNLAAFGLPLQGNIKLQNLRVQSNNIAMHIAYAIGGLRNVAFENVWLDGQGVCPLNGFYCEFGFASTNGQPGTLAAWTSSHPTNMSFKNMTITNLATGVSSVAFGMRGSYNCTIDGLYINTCDQALDISQGEAMYYRPWTQDLTTPDRNHELKKLTIKNAGFVGALIGSAGASGYLAATIAALAIPQRYQAQTDFLNFLVDGFNCEGCATGLQVAGGEVTVKNGTLLGNGASSSGGLIVGVETIHLSIENVQVLNFASIGVRYGLPAGIWSPVRPTFNAIRNCKICGNTVGIVLGATQSALIENNQIGYNTLYDVAGETTQVTGIQAIATSFGVRCLNNFVTTSTGANNYVSPNNTAGASNFVIGERNGTPTFSGVGNWITDITPAAAQVIAAAGTVTLANLAVARLAPAAAVAGVIMPAGTQPSQTVILINESVAASTITFAAAGTSRVADGVGAVIAGLTQKTFVWDSGTSLWYHS
jgi:hypothetical protein